MIRLLFAVAMLGVAACQSGSATEQAPAPKPSAGTVSSNDKVSDAGADH